MAERLADDTHQTLTEWKNDGSWAAWLEHGGIHLARWPALLGANLVEGLHQSRDGAGLLEEAARALAIKAAAYIHGSNDRPDLLPVAVPVDEAVHALTVQSDLLRAICDRAGVRILHRTPAQPLPYRPGCLAHDAYTAAWGTPPARYWLDHTTALARSHRLTRLYAHIGITAGRTPDAAVTSGSAPAVCEKGSPR
ncbi:hypothetical protein V2S66_18520 [Streptomyces sp. V4-01]|uniref:Uncharacterized protein n=1 Tax=Actinacidiphila polyblastidii TaxID=3110430 RepID=A0ABU7PDS5_9ACTN|nr:hypothetical protein [Streptomyces sp. V4-01]